MRNFLLIATVLFLTSACVTVNDTEPAQAELSNRAKARAVIESIETGNPEPIGYINPNKYIQHDLAMGDGLAGVGAVMAQLPKGSAKANAVRALFRQIEV